MTGQPIFEVPPENQVRLSDEQVASRLQIYNGDGKLQRDLREVWAEVGGVILEAATILWREVVDNRLPQLGCQLSPAEKERFVADSLAFEEMKYTTPIDAAWVERIAERARQNYSMATPMPLVVDDKTRSVAILVDRIRETFADDHARIRRSTDTIHRLTAIEIEILLSQIAVLERHSGALKRNDESGQFQQAIVDILESTIHNSDDLRVKTVSVAASARGMLGKASEVAAAAEQSAVAMRQAG